MIMCKYIYIYIYIYIYTYAALCIHIHIYHTVDVLFDFGCDSHALYGARI